MIIEIIPFHLYFIISLIFIASIKTKNNLKVKSIYEKEQLNVHSEEKIRFFLEDAEKKLLALKDLYDQDLISQKLYYEKTMQISEIVKKLIKNDVFEFAQLKNKEIINDLKIEIFEKLKNSFENESNDINLDSALKSIDKKIKNNEIKINEN